MWAERKTSANWLPNTKPIFLLLLPFRVIKIQIILEGIIMKLKNLWAWTHRMDESKCKLEFNSPRRAQKLLSDYLSSFQRMTMKFKLIVNLLLSFIFDWAQSDSDEEILILSKC